MVAKKTPFVFLENVDRLTKSPAKQRGRDFGIMLKCFDDLGYAVEWRIINAADYGFPQRHRRTYIFAYRKGKIKDKFPKENRNTNHVCHVRPHARVGLDHYVLPVADKQTGITSYTKQSFWFNKDFIEKIIKE